MLEEVRPRSVLNKVRASRGAPEDENVIMMVLNAIVTSVSFPYGA
ncbi:hypothetical protein [Neorhizobium galegae]|nr:hypothetical protein [Neorhizobium galegae]